MRIRIVVGSLVTALMLGFLPVPQASGQNMTDLYVVHGLNLDGQTGQTDGGTSVTVCVASTNPPLISNLEFGDTEGPFPLESGVAVDIDVYQGGAVDCETPGGAMLLIDQSVIPMGEAVSLVATGDGGSALDPELLPLALPVSCNEPDSGRLHVAHAGNFGTLDVLVDGSDVADLEYGDSYADDLPASSYLLQVDLQGSFPIVGPESQDVTEGELRSIFVVGNQVAEDASTPVVSIILDIALVDCVAPVIAPAPTMPVSGLGLLILVLLMVAARSLPARRIREGVTDHEGSIGG